MSKIRATMVVLAVALFVGAIALQVRVFVEQQEPKGQKNFFEMSLEQLMDVEITLASEEKEELSRAAPAIYLIDYTV